MQSAQELAGVFRTQAGICGAMGSAFNQALGERCAVDLDAGGRSAELLSPWFGRDARRLFADAVALRWLGAFHDRALRGVDPPLTLAYPAPGRPGDPPAAWSAIETAMRDDPAELASFMQHEPQTNEVLRSACLLPGFLAIARATGLPLRLLELGASAGLNQFWDRYAYDFGAGGVWGEPASPVRLAAEWRGPAPDLDQAVSVASRAACDRSPVGLEDSAARRRLRAYVWPDQFERLGRLDAAVALARRERVTVERADALAFTRDRGAPQPGLATVIYHSIFWQYLPQETQRGLADVIEAFGAQAKAEAPLAWLRMEPVAGNPSQIEVRLTLWPSGEERRLGACSPHGTWIAPDPD